MYNNYLYVCSPLAQDGAMELRVNLTLDGDLCLLKLEGGYIRVCVCVCERERGGEGVNEVRERERRA